MRGQPIEQLQEIFEQALERPATERAAFLAEACGDDGELRASVERLLKAHEEAAQLPSERISPLSVRDGLRGLLEGDESIDWVPTPDVQPGARIDRYKLLQEIGEGGFGTVWMAEQEEPVRRKVALKVIKMGMDTKEVIARFEAERQALAMMDHPHIAKVFDAGATDQGRPYFVMELVKGIPITEYCDVNNLSPRERLELFVPVCQALQHAHQKGVIHRDIKPSNILVTLHDGKPVPKVIDFGIAKATNVRLTEKTLFTRFRALLGTPVYMSPEQAEMSGLDVDTRSDVYSLGVILYELLTGSTPFDPESLCKAGYGEIQRIIREEEPQKPSTRLSTLGDEGLTAVAKQRQVEPRRLCRLLRGELDWIVMRALEKDRTRRYETAAALALDVERYLMEEPVAAGPPSRLYRMRKFARRNRVAVTTASLVLGAVIIGLVLATYGFLRAEWQSGIARKEARRSQTVIGLIQEMFSSANPHENKGPSYTVRELLDDFTRGGLWDEVSREPEVELTLRQTIGDAYRGLGEYARAGPHIDRALELALRHKGDEDPETVKGLRLSASLLFHRGLYREARERFERAASLGTKALGRDHPETLTSLDGLAVAMGFLAEYPEGVALALEVLEKRRRTLGEEHRDTLETMGNLSSLYLKQERHEDAETLSGQVLDVRRRTLGDEHPDTITAMNNQAVLYVVQRRYADAEGLLKEALETTRRTFGERHLATLLRLRNLAMLHERQGRLKEAQRLLEEVLQTSLRSLGKEHPDTLMAMIGLALVYGTVGRYDEAESLYRRVLAVLPRILGEEHPRTIETTNSLALLFGTQERYAEAEALRRKVLAMQQRALGEGHPDTLDSMNNLAMCCARQGRHDEAKGLSEKVLEISRRTLGEKHPQALKAMNTLTVCCAKQGRHDEAKLLCEKVLEISRQTLGEKHPQTLTAMTNLASLHGRERRYGEAEVLRRKLFEIHRREHGDSHPDTLTSLYNLAMCCEKQGRYEESKQLHMRAMATSRSVGGEEHPLPLESVEILAKCYRALGKDEAVVTFLDLQEDARKNAVWEPEEVHEIIPRGSIWRYLDTGADAGTAWREANYDDTGWNEGRAPLGYGEQGLGTVVGSGSGDGDRVTTMYLRRTFEVARPERMEALKVRLRRDDGAAVYINGEEVVRDNLAPDASHDDFGLKKVGTPWELCYFVFLVPPEVLRPGTNTIAVEIHQSDPKSSDVVFDLSLEAKLKNSLQAGDWSEEGK